MPFVTPHSRRVHVTDPFDWNRSGGTDYWAVFGPESITSATGRLLSDQGWLITSVLEVAGTGTDFIATGDRANPAHGYLDAASDILQSPSIFGDYGHAQIAANILGYQPTKLVMECYAAFNANANEVSGFGFTKAGGSPLTAVDNYAMISSDGTNFRVRSAAGSDLGAAVDTLWHVWKIAADATNFEWFIDGTSQGTLTNSETDVLPVSFAAGVVVAGTAFQRIAWAHVWYE